MPRNEHGQEMLKHPFGTPEQLGIRSPTSLEQSHPYMIARDQGFEEMIHPPPPLADITIEGIEASQCTQFYKSERHLGAPYAEPDNSIPLIKNKSLAIRVYPDIGQFIPFLLDGEVLFKRSDRPEEQSYQIAPRLNGPVWGRRAIDIDRGNADHTLNFHINEVNNRGPLIVYARVWGNLGGRRLFSNWYRINLDFIEVPAVRIRAHGIQYSFRNINVGAPTLNEFIATAAYLEHTYPTSGFEWVSYDVQNFSGDLTDTSGGGCGAGWGALFNLLQQLYMMQDDALHYGLLGSGIPAAYTGCGGGNVGASFVGAGSTMAQELGHALGRMHAPGCGAGNVDPNYPNYSGLGTSTIGEFGINTSIGVTFDPDTSNDFMGYCSNPWVSPYTYRGLIDGINNQPTAFPAAVNPHLEDRRYEREHLYAVIEISRDGKAELLSGTRLKGPCIKSRGRHTPYVVEIRDKTNHILFSKRLMLTDPHEDLDEAHTHYYESLPIYEGASKLIFKCKNIDNPYQIEESVLDISDKPLVVRIKSLPKKEQTGRVKLEWTLDDKPKEKVTYVIRYSNDDGNTWIPVTIAQEKTEYEVDLDHLPGGSNCKFQVIASTILAQGTAESTPLSVKKKKRVAAITPVSLDGKKQSQFIELAGFAYSPDGSAKKEELKWFSNLQGYLGRGIYLTVKLIPGEHIISLVAPDGEGSVTRAEYHVQIWDEGIHDL